MESTTIKIVTIGSVSTGKTSILYAYVMNTFMENHVATIFDHFSTIVKYEDKIINMSLYDSAGAPEYARLRALSYPNTDVFIICYSLIDPKSFEDIKYEWYPEIKHYSPETPFIIVGTKSDELENLETQKILKESNIKPVNPNDTLNLGKELGAYKTLTCSSLNCEGIKDVFTSCIQAYFHNLEVNTRRQPKKTGCLLI